MRLSEYDEDEARLSKLLGRNLFRQAISEHAPKVLEHLAGEPFAVARDVFAKGQKSLSFDPLLDLQNWDDVCLSAYDKQPGVRELRDTLTEWGRLFHLEEGWCYTLALQTLINWIAGEDDYQQRSWGPMGGGMWKATFRREETVLELGSFEYDPTCDTRPDARKRLQKIVDKVKAHMNDLDAEAETRGLEKTRGIAQEEHFRWLVEFQINEQTMYGVLKQLATDRTEQTVRSGIHSSAEVIDRRLRPHPGQAVPADSSPPTEKE